MPHGTFGVIGFGVPLACVKYIKWKLELSIGTNVIYEIYLEIVYYLARRWLSEGVSSSRGAFLKSRLLHFAESGPGQYV